MKPYFLWDYDLSEQDIKKILRGENETDKLWLMGRILTHAHFRDIFKYLSIEEISSNLARLKLPPDIKKSWEYALSVWGYHVESH